MVFVRVDILKSLRVKYGLRLPHMQDLGKFK